MLYTVQHALSLLCVKAGHYTTQAAPDFNEDVIPSDMGNSIFLEDQNGETWNRFDPCQNVLIFFFLHFCGAADVSYMAKVVSRSRSVQSACPYWRGFNETI